MAKNIQNCGQSDKGIRLLSNKTHIRDGRGDEKIHPLSVLVVYGTSLRTINAFVSGTDNVVFISRYELVRFENETPGTLYVDSELIVEPADCSSDLTCGLYPFRLLRI